jgi:hypothetical protein
MELELKIDNASSEDLIVFDYICCLNSVNN